jgi:GNAT superfamily N-acetyltransferase
MFRKAQLADLDGIEKIYSDIHTREEAGLVNIGWVRSIYPTRATAQAAIEVGDMFVLEEEGEIIAAARINREQVAEYAMAPWRYPAAPEQVMVLHTLVVSPSAARRGYGSQFVDFYERYAAENGCFNLRLDTNVKNSHARALYKKLGYAEVGVVPCRFNGIEGVSLLCLEKKL